MTAYATAEQLFSGAQLRPIDPARRDQKPGPRMADGVDLAVLDRVLVKLADLVVDRLMERAAATSQPANEWMDAREAAEYLGVHRDTLRKLAAERTVPVHQDGPGCKLYFRRDELDDWRRSRKAAQRRLRVMS